MVQKTNKYINGKKIQVFKRFQVTSEGVPPYLSVYDHQYILVEKMSYDVDNFGIVAQGLVLLKGLL